MPRALTRRRGHNLNEDILFKVDLNDNMIEQVNNITGICERSSSVYGTYNNILTEFSSNTAAFVDDINDSSRKVLMTNPPKTNYVQYSEDLTQWTTPYQGSITGTTIEAPDGTNTCYGFISNTSNDWHAIRIWLSNTLIGGKLYTLSYYVSAGDQPRVNPWIEYYDSGWGYLGGNYGSGAIDVASWTYESANGFSRIEYSFEVPVYGSDIAYTLLNISPATAGGSRTYTGDGTTVSAWFWGIQIEENPGQCPSSYIPTNGSIASRSSESVYWNIPSTDRNNIKHFLSSNATIVYNHIFSSRHNGHTYYPGDSLISMSTPPSGKTEVLEYYDADNAYDIYADLNNTYASVVGNTIPVSGAAGYYVVLVDDNGREARGWAKSSNTVIYGSSIVTNGDFSSGTTGWGIANSALLSNIAGGVSGNCLRIDENGEWGPAAFQTLSVTSNALYENFFYIKQGNTSNYYTKTFNSVWNSIGSLYATAGASWAQHSRRIRSVNTTTIYAYYGINENAASAKWGQYDNIEFRRIHSPGPNGVEIYQDSDFSSRGWDYVESGFDLNNIEFMRCYTVSGPIAKSVIFYYKLNWTHAYGSSNGSVWSGQSKNDTRDIEYRISVRMQSAGNYQIGLNNEWSNQRIDSFDSTFKLDFPLQIEFGKECEFRHYHKQLSIFKNYSTASNPENIDLKYNKMVYITI